jgi:hypothetical protein
MSTPETYMRAALAKPEYQNAFERMCKDMDAIPILYSSSIEAHPGRRTKKGKEEQEQQPEGDEGNALQGENKDIHPNQV